MSRLGLSACTEFPRESSKCGGRDAIIVEGDGTVSERKLGAQSPGRVLKTSVTAVL